MGPGWYFTAVYGNLYRSKQFISFKICHLQASKKICLVFAPQESNQLPYFTFQIITNYLYNRQHFITINTIVLPLTCMIDKLFANTDYAITSASLFKTYLSCYRLQEVNQGKNKMIKQLAVIWRVLNEHYKKVQLGYISQKVPAQASGMMLGCLGFLKSQHSMLDSINDSMPLDTVISQRNYFQSCGSVDINSFFSPYLFNLSNLDETRCQDDELQ